VREALNASYIGKWNLENLVVNMEIDSFALSGKCAAIRAGTFEEARANLSCVAGQGAFAGFGLSHPTVLVMDDAQTKNRRFFNEKRMSWLPGSKRPRS
jgi:hypothetical protein